jgi:hypothetical protein
MGDLTPIPALTPAQCSGMGNGRPDPELVLSALMSTSLRRPRSTRPNLAEH